MSESRPYYPHMHHMKLNGDRKVEKFTEKDLYKLVKNEVGKLVNEQNKLEKRLEKFLYDLSQLRVKYEIFIDKNGNIIDEKTGKIFGSLSEFAD